MSSWYVTGRMIVERFEDGSTEVQDITAVANTPYAEAAEDLEASIFDAFDVPEEPGVYSLMYTARMFSTQDYWGEWDCDAEPIFHYVSRLSADEAKAFTDNEYPDPEPASLDDFLKAHHGG